MAGAATELTPSLICGSVLTMQGDSAPQHVPRQRGFYTEKLWWELHAHHLERGAWHEVFLHRWIISRHLLIQLGWYKAVTSLGKTIFLFIPRRGELLYICSCCVGVVYQDTAASQNGPRSFLWGDALSCICFQGSTLPGWRSQRSKYHNIMHRQTPWRVQQFSWSRVPRTAASMIPSLLQTVILKICLSWCQQGASVCCEQGAWNTHI